MAGTNYTIIMSLTQACMCCLRILLRLLASKPSVDKNFLSDNFRLMSGR